MRIGLPFLNLSHKHKNLVNNDLLVPILGIFVIFVYLIVFSYLIQVYPQQNVSFLIIQIGFLCIGAYLLYLIYFRIKQTLTEPLSQLRSWALSMRSGNLSAKIPIPSEGEFALLANDINDLGESLRSLTSEMDHKVKEQTRSLEQKSNMLEILYDVAASSNTAGDTTELLSRNLSTLADILSAHYATVRVLTNDEQLKLVASKGLNKNIDPSEQIVPIEHCLCAMNNSKELIECSSDSKYCGGLLVKSIRAAQSLKNTPQDEVRSVIAIPLRHNNRTLGIYNLFLTKKYSDDWEIDNLLINIGRHLSFAMIKAKLDDETKRNTIMEERTMLAHELHDSLAQTLASLRFRVSLINRILLQEGNKTVLPDIVQLRNGLDEANNELRELLVHFRVPMDERGLSPAVEGLIERFRSESGISVFFQNECTDISLPPSHEVQVLHIIQESLTNIRKHSSAQHVRILMRSNPSGNYHVLIEDDGVGIKAGTIDGEPGQHVGLSIMQERANRISGKVLIESELGDGTRVELDFQINPQQAESLLSNLNDKRGQSPLI